MGAPQCRAPAKNFLIALVADRKRMTGGRVAVDGAPAGRLFPCSSNAASQRADSSVTSEDGQTLKPDLSDSKQQNPVAIHPAVISWTVGAALARNLLNAQIGILTLIGHGRVSSRAHRKEHQPFCMPIRHGSTNRFMDLFMPQAQAQPQLTTSLRCRSVVDNGTVEFAVMNICIARAGKRSAPFSIRRSMKAGDHETADKPTIP